MQEINEGEIFQSREFTPGILQFTLKPKQFQINQSKFKFD